MIPLRQRKNAILGIALSIILAVSLYAFSQLEASPEAEETADLNDGRKTVELIQANAFQDEIPTITTVGTVRSSHEVDIRPEVSGRIVALPVNLGDRVAAGSILMEIDHNVEDAQVFQAEASLSAEQATLAKLKAGDRPEDLEIAEQRLLAARQRLTELQNGARSEEVDIAETNLATARETLADHQRELDNARSRAGQDAITVLQNSIDIIQQSAVTVKKILNNDLKPLINTTPIPYNRLCEVEFESFGKSELKSECYEVMRSADIIQAQADSFSGADISLVSIVEKVDTTKYELETVRIFLAALLKLVSGANTIEDIKQPDSDRLLTEYKRTVASAQSELEAIISKVTAQAEGLRSQDVANVTSIDLAQNRVNQSAYNVLKLEKELILKKSSARPEQLAIQRSEVRQLEIRVDLAKKGARVEDVQVQEARVRQRQADLAIARANREKTIVRAPANGSVIRLDLEVGDQVSPSDLAMIIANQDILEVVTFITEGETDIVGAAGTSIALQGTPAKGSLAYISPAVDRDTKKIEVIGILEEGFDLLLIGQTVYVDFIPVKPPTSIRVPLTAIRVISDEPVVFTLNFDNEVVAVPVKLGRVYDDKIEVMELSAEQPIIQNAAGIEIGEKVLPSFPSS